ncbi:MAG: hypothetical protein ACRBFS_04635 [Aureispira sp.]
MVLRIAAFLSIGWYGLLFFLGFHYLELDQQLLAVFFEEGWQNYNGPSLSSPENQYFGLWLFSTLGSAFVLHLLPSDKTALIKTLLLINISFLVSYLFLFLIDGDISMNESKIWWIITSVSQLVGHGMLAFEYDLTNYTNKTLKYIFLLQALTYGGLLSLGFYYLQWDAELVAESTELGWEHHENVMVPEGRAVKVPEMNYHLILILACILSFALLILTKNSNQWRAALFFTLIGFTLYSAIVYFNGYSYTMQETKGWWIGGCSMVIALSSILFWQTKAPEPDFDPIHQDNLLDDLSGLE